MKQSNTYKRHCFPPAIIHYAVWLKHRFNLSHRDTEDLLAERGISVSYSPMVQQVWSEVSQEIKTKASRVWQYVLH